MSMPLAERIQGVIDALATAQLVLSSPVETDDGVTCARDELLMDILSGQRR